MPETNLVSGRLERSELYKKLREKSALEGDSVQAKVMALINDAGTYCHDKLKTVVRHLPEFTLHDEVHIFKVVYLMEKLLPEKTKEVLSVPELLLLILTALFHDVGMSVEERKVRAWKKDWDNDGDSFEREEFDKFSRFCQSYPDKIYDIKRLNEAGKHTHAQLINEYLISEYIRQTHADRTREIIATDWSGKIRYKNTDLTDEFAQLCFSHNQDAAMLLKMNTSVMCDEQEFACLPFIGVILRLADLLDFDPKRTPEILFSHLSVRNPVSIKEWNKNRAINAWSISPSTIIFSAKCSHPAIEAAIYEFCDYIDAELRNCSHILAHISDDFIRGKLDFYKIQLPASVDRSRIGPIQDISTGKPLYIYRSTQFTLSKTQVIDLLMGTKLYGSTEVALRELIQNSIDACAVRKHMEDSWGENFVPNILVHYFTEDGVDYLEVEDNGIGMNQYIVDTYYSKVGSSFYKSKEFYDLLALIGQTYVPISEFGIGILSCFMVSDSIEVQTRRLNPDQELDNPINIIVEGYDSIFYVQEGKRKRPGTKTRLLLRNENPWKRMSHSQFIESVKKSVPNPPFNIEIQTDKEVITHNRSYFNELMPDSLANKYWDDDKNIRKISFDCTDLTLGIMGRAMVGILEKNGNPVENIEILSKSAVVEGEQFELSLCLNYSDNEIEKQTTSIDIADSGEIETSSHHSVIARSRSSFSINGIHFPDGLFSDSWFKRRQAELKWPFPLLLVLDVTAPNHLDLKSSRTEIIYNGKWQKFESDLSFLICSRIYEALDQGYALKLFSIYEKRGKDLFKDGLSRAIRSKVIK